VKGGPRYIFLNQDALHLQKVGEGLPVARVRGKGLGIKARRRFLGETGASSTKARSLDL